MKYVTRFEVCRKNMLLSTTSASSSIHDLRQFQYVWTWTLVGFINVDTSTHFTISSLIFVLKAKSQGVARRRNPLRRIIISAEKNLTSEDFASSPICFICVHIQTWGACRSMYIYWVLTDYCCSYIWWVRVAATTPAPRDICVTNCLTFISFS